MKLFKRRLLRFCKEKTTARRFVPVLKADVCENRDAENSFWVAFSLKEEQKLP